ncbi:hypothetical protein P9239_14010 [Caballeronia sp. LZ062]|uniref:hypothetical protein n=1 Tax=unclassified Caballeronia TaxID=2646786 RepID=UPI00285CAEC5|nr:MULTISPECIES: hypothetical protein [unclassified Caballeronia]MDR5854010.1 hypothetical protein [Caballeronia sp. LZ050]MDR5871459.1 hypothetical protein [Caballeronia sp. LZ062]
MKTKKMALVGALALAFSTAAFAQASDSAATTDAASSTHGKKGTYLHQQNKSHKLKGASAAAAASSLGTNDKGQPH